MSFEDFDETMGKVLTSAKDITIEVSNSTLLEDVTLSLSEGDRVGLVGPNGSGKSTLVKTLAGFQEPTSGDVVRKGSSYYVPQLDLPMFRSDMQLMDYLSEQHNEWWEITEILENNFGFGEVNLQQTLNTLSGGELMKLHLAIASAKHPHVLYLDEPTNHLDIVSIQELIGFLQGYKGAVVVISHDPFFLDQVTTSIWEIENKKVNRFGGNYTDYREQKTAQLESLSRQHDAAKKELEKVRRSIQREQQRAAKSTRTGKQMKHDRSMSAVEKGFFKNRASESAGKHKGLLDQAKADAQQKIDQTRATKTKKAHLDLDTDRSATGQTIVRGSALELKIDDEKELIKDGEISVSHGDRVVLTGRNGSGKTLLLKTLTGQNAREDVELDGEVYVADNSNIVYLSQKYEIVDPELTLEENIKKVNPSLPYEIIRKQLGNFLFFHEEDIRKRAGVLSGGETARLAMAMITAAPVDLLVLDEPTNNLDLDTVDSIVDALEDFKGGIVVISHNMDFLSRMGVDKAYVISNKKLKRLYAHPDEPDQFFEELMSELEQ